MAKNRSEKSKYQSLSTGDFCTAAQYVTELLLLREFKKKNNVPVYKFWNDEPWKSKFSKYIIAISRMINKFSEEAVTSFFEKEKWRYTPLVKGLDLKIKEVQDIIDSREKQVIEVTHTEKSKPMKSSQKTKRAKLGDI